MAKFVAVVIIGLFIVGCGAHEELKKDNTYQRANKAYDKAMDELNKN